MYLFAGFGLTTALILTGLLYTEAVRIKPAQASGTTCREGYAPAKGNYGVICVPGYTP